MIFTLLQEKKTPLYNFAMKLSFIVVFWGVKFLQQEAYSSPLNHLLASYFQCMMWILLVEGWQKLLPR